MADISQGKHRLAAVTFTTSHGGDGACWRNGRLGGIADAVQADRLAQIQPINFRPSIIVLIRLERLRRLPAHGLRIVNAALNCRESAACLRQLNAGLHAHIAHILHYLGRKFLTFLRAVADTCVVHQVAQPHQT